eukprot:Skav221825  [mRNA]  locus=scaffold885:155678:158043:- [translate_table: standard]
MDHLIESELFTAVPVQPSQRGPDSALNYEGFGLPVEVAEAALDDYGAVEAAVDDYGAAEAALVPNDFQLPSAGSLGHPEACLGRPELLALVHSFCEAKAQGAAGRAPGVVM